MGLPRAFVLTGSFLVVCRAPLYFQQLRERGLRILLVTPSSWRSVAQAAAQDPLHPSQALSDIAFVDGSVDKENSFTAGVIAAVRAWRSRYDIVGTYAVGETLVEPTGLVADGLGLPSPGLRASRACRSKYLQRWYAPELSPFSLTIPAGSRESVDVSTVRYPAVVKPASRHSSSGVTTVSGITELYEKLAEFPAHESVLVETKVVGPEFSVESLVQGGEIVFASVTRKETTESDGWTFVELSHTVPNDKEVVNTTLLMANRRLLSTLDVRDGITHAEFRVDEAGRPALMEVAARTPGDGICLLYQLATGAPLEPELVRIALGEKASYPAPARYARQVYLEHEFGELVDVTVDWPGVTAQWVGESGIWPDLKPAVMPDEPAALRAVLVHREPGDQLTALRSSEDRSVSFFIDAATVAELDEIEQRVRAAIDIHVR